MMGSRVFGSLSRSINSCSHPGSYPWLVVSASPNLQNPTLRSSLRVDINRACLPGFVTDVVAFPPNLEAQYGSTPLPSRHIYLL